MCGNCHGCNSMWLLYASYPWCLIWILVLIFTIRGHHQSYFSDLCHHGPCHEGLCRRARVKCIPEAMASSLNEFVSVFERLTSNPEDYLRYNSNVSDVVKALI
jgi:hypothetical protein